MKKTLFRGNDRWFISSREENIGYNREGEKRLGKTSFFFFAICHIWKEIQMAKKENQFQSELIKDIKLMLPNCMVLKNDPNYIQGIPDLIVLNENKWAALECKRSKDSPSRPNQPYYISKMAEMSYAAFVYPENKEDILYELSKSLGS